MMNIGLIPKVDPTFRSDALEAGRVDGEIDPSPAVDIEPLDPGREGGLLLQTLVLCPEFTLVALFHEDDTTSALPQEGGGLGPRLDHLEVRTRKEDEAGLAIAEGRDLRIVARHVAGDLGQSVRQLEGAQVKLGKPENADCQESGRDEACP